MLTQARVKELFDYNPETGKLIWRKRELCDGDVLRIVNGWNTRFEGKTAGYLDDHGYYRTRIGKPQYRIHQLVWAYHNADAIQVPYEIDHIDGDRTNNRIENLRLVLPHENSQNTQRDGKAKPSSTNGFIGVRKVGNTICARISVNMKRIHLGTFKTLEEARDAYIQAKLKYHQTWNLHG